MAGSLRYPDSTRRPNRTGLYSVRGFGAAGDGVTDDTAAVARAVAAAQAAGGGTVVLDGPAFRTTAPTLYDRTVSFCGTGYLTTIWRYRGPAGTFALVHDLTTGVDQWPGRNMFRDFTIEGDGTGTLGTGATVGGIRCADDTDTLVNIPWYSIRNVRFRRCTIGAQLEGYGHHFQETIAYDCGIGYDLTHPEQGMMLNTWAEYCDVGIQVNKRKAGFGHKLHIIGGSYQRSRIGIEILGFFEPTIDTYCELNTEADVRLGDPADPSSYTKGVKDPIIALHSASPVASGASVDLYATENARIHYFAYSGTGASTTPHVRTNGYCKRIDVEYSNITSSTPWDFQGDSVGRAVARLVGGAEAPTAITPTAPFTTQAGYDLQFYKTGLDMVALRGPVNSNTLGGATVMFTLPVGYRPAQSLRFPVSQFDSAAGTWSTGHVQVATTGIVSYLSAVNSRLVHLDGIQFRIPA